MNQTEKLLEIQNVVKRFGKATVLDHVSLNIEKGSIHGLVGRNGSGKTLLLKCICGMIPVTEGRILYKGKEIGKEIELPDHMGALIESPGFLEEYDGLWNLRFLGMMTGVTDRNHLMDLLSLVGLDPNSRLKVSKYSMGMKQRLGIAQAILEDPELLLLDEPMNGLDNHGVGEMRKLFRKLNEKGTTIIIASHIADDIRILCDRVTYLDQGKIIKEESAG